MCMRVACWPTFRVSLCTSNGTLCARYNNLANAVREKGGPSALDEAILCYRSALRLKPDHPHAYNNLGNALRAKGLVKEAIHCYVTAARLMPK